jgi:gas vesicle protein
MPQLTQGLIVAALIGLLLAVIVGYYLRQGQVNELTQALQQSQKRQEDLEKEHEQRLRTATQQLQRDYEAQLAEKMEQYQDRLEERRGQLEAEYRTRQSVMGGAPVDADSTTEQRIRKQYETRLKEAATKIQQAYEQHLQDKLVEARSQAQQDYDQRLAEAIAHYQDQQTRQAPSAIALGALVPEPMAVADSGIPDVAEIEARLQAEYDQRLAQMQQDYEARLAQAGGSVPDTLDPAVLNPSAAELELNLRRELEESLRAEYEQKLAEKIEHYQDELTQRTLELEQAYEARLQLQASPFPEPPTPVVEEPAVDLDMAMLEEAMPPEAAIADTSALIADSEISLDMNEFSSGTPSPGIDEDDAALAALLVSEADGGQGDVGLDADINSQVADSSQADVGLDAGINSAEVSSDDLDVDEFNASAPDTISDLSELNFDDPGEFSLEATSPGSDTSGFGLADLVEGETDSSQVDDLGLEPSADVDSLDLSALLNEATTAPSSEVAMDEFAFESAPASAESDFGLAGLLENDTDRDQVDNFGLDTDFNADSLDLNALLNEPTLAPSSEFAIDEFAPEAASSELGEGDFGLAALLEGEADSGQVDDFGLDNDFNTDSLDLDALLNTPAPEPTSDEMLDDLDDLSNLS